MTTDRPDDNARPGRAGPAAKRRPASRTAPGRRPSKSPRAQPAPDRDAETRVFGLHAATFALKNPARRITAIHVTENAERRLADALAGHHHLIARASPRDLDKRLGPDTVHQGVLLELAPLEPEPLEALITRAHETGLPIIILDQVTDPHNVGAVLRSAAVFGAAGLVMTYRHSPPLGGALAKAASGALELTPVALVRNLAEAIADLRAAAITVIGLDATGDTFLETALDGASAPVAIALGAEGKGLRELTRQSCDRLCRITGDGPITSLNVSNAAAVALNLSAMSRRARNAPAAP